MINSLHYAVTFPTNGVSLNGTHTFQPGTTAVSGRNGTGKSFIAEMIRYGLFGKKALRGPASDYKTLDMWLGFTVGGQRYDVARGKKEQLFDPNNEVIAVGADAVNKKILEILGFGLEVFDVVCAANQKESERLTQLTPAKRKELIDDVVGLTTQEAVEKACKDEATGLRREAEALVRALVLPVEPEKPKGYRSSANIGVELKALKELVEKRAALQRIIDAVGDAPAKPSDAVVDVEALEEHEQERLVQKSEQSTAAANLARIPEVTYTPEQLDHLEDFQAYAVECHRRGDRPTVPLAQLDQMAETWATITALKKIGDTEVQCPSCDIRFCPGHETPAEPELSPSEIAAERRAHDAWSKPIFEVQPSPLMGKVTDTEIKAARLALSRADERAELQRIVAEPTLEDKSVELRAGRATNQAWAIYRAAAEQYHQRLIAMADAMAELKRLKAPKQTVAELDALFVAARVYESQVEAYDAAKKRFDDLSAEIAEKQARAEGFTAGAKGLVEARRTLKAFLAPSLSRVASKLISEMTVNAHRPLSQIEIDEEMNITADGQDVGTFNGAGATMINLALRLALGQVLVSRVFPLFIGDEIDSDADDDNSQAIADALMACKEQLKQIIVISHKRLEGMDEEIVL